MPAVLVGSLNLAGTAIPVLRLGQLFGLPDLPPSLYTPLVILVLLVAKNLAAQQKSILFDAAHAQTAGNADWTLDEDSCGTAQRFPTPDQAGITSSTAETFWNGAHSAMGVDLVKKGFHVESLPVGARISYGDGTNAQDLSHYNIFVMPEPNIALTSTEIQKYALGKESAQQALSNAAKEIRSRTGRK